LLKIIDFTKDHIEQAQGIAKENYENERKYVDCLPEVVNYPDFIPLIENGLGVSAFVDQKMIGYLCCLGPFDKAFETTNTVGVWSPLHANGVIECEHKNVFARMYQEAARKWVNMKAVSHAITFYSHNHAVKNQLYRYGFGLRCIDTIRKMDELEIKQESKYYISELEHHEFHLVFPIGLMLEEHLSQSPIFMRGTPDEIEEGHEHKFADWQIHENYRYFAARDGEKIIAYMKIHDEGENFIGDTEDMKHIHGAYCFPEYRGQGVIQHILNFIIKKLQAENIKLLGVDFESFNPTADNFWLKYFTEYTHSVVRQIDDVDRG
jgi:GNAT superfamily N-acetyltransferase